MHPGIHYVISARRVFIFDQDYTEVGRAQCRLTNGRNLICTLSAGFQDALEKLRGYLHMYIWYSGHAGRYPHKGIFLSYNVYYKFPSPPAFTRLINYINTSGIFLNVPSS